MKASASASEARTAHALLMETCKKEAENLDYVKAIREHEKELVEMGKTKEVLEHAISGASNTMNYLKKNATSSDKSK
jgi:hypothetical protein